MKQDAIDIVPQKFVWSTPPRSIIQFHKWIAQVNSFTSRRKPTVTRRAGLTAPLVLPNPWRQRYLNVRSYYTTQKATNTNERKYKRGKRNEAKRIERYIEWRNMC